MLRRHSESCLAHLHFLRHRLDLCHRVRPQLLGVDLDEPEAVDGRVEAVGDVAKVRAEVVEAVTDLLRRK